MIAGNGMAADLTVLFAQGFDACIFSTSLLTKVYRKDTITNFAAAVSQLAPRAPVRPTVVAVLLGELSIVATLLGGAVIPGFLLSLGMVTAFTVVIAGAIRERRRVACQCFGHSASPVSVVHLGRNAVILGVTLVGITGLPFVSGHLVILSPSALGILSVALVAAACTVAVDQFSDLFVTDPKEK